MANRTYKKNNFWLVTLVTTLATMATLSVTSCSVVYPRQQPVGQRFPSVQGKALDDKVYSIPESFNGEVVLLLVGYKMDTQFDLDRWILGLHDTKVSIPVYEVPTIPGMVPGLFAERINDGMRSGIPSEDWAIVITLYDDAHHVARFLGNENSLPTRVVLLDREGHVRFFPDRGFSLKTLLALQDEISKGVSEPGAS